MGSRLWCDLRAAICGLRRRPGATLSAIVVLALGIGATTSIFSVIDGLLLNPLPYRGGDRLVYLYRHNEALNATTSPSRELVQAAREQARSFEQIETYAEETFLLGGEGEPARVAGARVSAGFFGFLGVRPVLGRSFLASEGREGGDRVAVLGHGLWRSRFGGDPKVLERSVVVNGEPCRVVGVLPAGFRLESYSPLQIWLPALEGAAATAAGGPVYAVARLAEGVPPTEAEAEFGAISARLPADEETGLAWKGIVETPQDRVGSRQRTAIIALQAAVVFILLIACANVAGLLLAQGESRFRELAVRSVLGASRGRLMVQLMTESLVLGLAGGAAGLLFARLGLQVIPDLLPGAPSHVEFSTRHAVFAFVVSVLSGVLFGLVPALKGSAARSQEGLRMGARTAGAPRRRVRGLLVVGEVALAMVLLLGAGVLLRSFLNLQNLHPGFDPDGLLTVRLELPEEWLNEDRRVERFAQALLDEVNGAMGPHSDAIVLASDLVSEVSAVGGRPEVEGQPPRADAPQELLTVTTAMPGYFRGIGLPLVKGRDFTDEDRHDTEAVIVVNETLARRYFAGLDPVGRRVRFSRDWYRVVGVAADTRLPMLAAERLGQLQVYFPFRQHPTNTMTLAVRSSAPPSTLAAALKALVWRVDPAVPVIQVGTARELMRDSVRRQRMNALLMTAFAAVALVLAAVGMYALIAHSVGRRTQEIGLRLALGATRRNVLREVVGQGMALVVFGLLLGSLGALALGRVLSSLLFEVEAWDPLSFLAAILTVTAAAFLASLIPARRAAGLDPADALRRE